ncbi:Alpha/Beta hydrolase protein [Crassisporium funariophilum]|nr:Alpha/Beta hydrolase protein [Crassisporium funariophilum]
MPEQYLDLPGGRSLAYSESGNSSSSILVLFFHGVFGVGQAPSSLPKILSEKNIHYIAPTLSGWGKSSPRAVGVPYHVALATDITALIDHLHPHDLNLKIYIAGGSYGTVPAQMLYGAPFDIFPFGRYLAGCMVLAPFSPPTQHTDFAKCMTLPNYIAVGPPTRYIPFKILPRLMSYIISGKVKTTEKAEVFIRSTLFDKMQAEELAAFTQWKKENGKVDGQVEREFAENMVKSVQESWDGFMEVADVLHGDWGFSITALDQEHNKRPMLVVASEGDTLAPDGMAKWLHATYQNSRMKSITGGHLASLFQLNDLWTELLEM